MKKLVLTAAVMGFAASMASAQEPVYSQNIVGYAKTTLAAGSFEIVSPQFLVGDNDGVTLSNAFSGVSDGSVVFAWTGTGYDSYTYYVDGGGWFDLSFNDVGGEMIGQGDAVWLKSGAGEGSVAIMAGEVSSADSITVTLTSGFNLVASPYPVAITLGDLATDALSDGDSIFVWSGSGYDSYTYYVDGGGWFDLSFNDASGIEIGVGQGFWLNSSAGGTMVFDKSF